MDNPSITINGDEGLTSLQIDCDLAASTGLTSASSTLTTPFTTPKNNRTGNGGGSSNNKEPSTEWIALYERLKRTPPKATRTAHFHDTLTAANALLKLSDESDFKDKSFVDLTDDQKAILMLMIMKGMHNIFDGGRQTSAKVLINALRPESLEYKRMASFVHPGGDCRCLVQTLILQKTLRKIQTFETAQKATTIFKDRPNMLPFLHLQREDSYICTFNACSALLYYCSHNTKGETNDEESISTIKMNISRYIRDEVPGHEIANFCLTTVKGAYVERILLGLMKSFGTTDCHSVEYIPTWEKEKRNFDIFESYLEDGRPFVFGVECFPGLGNKIRFNYTGKVVDYYDDNSDKRPKDPKDRLYHALLCTGITPRNGSLPPMLLVQDSCYDRPVFEIGLDLLMDLGLENSKPCTVPKKWTFNNNMDYMVSPETKALFCGSPMAIDDKGVPRIIKTEKPIQMQREDMSRYLDEVTVKPGELGIVVMS